MSFLWNPPEKVVPTEERIKKMTFDIFFILTISTSMYVAWYAYRAPSGVSHIWHTLAAAAGVWMAAFFAYFMVGESPVRPQYHMRLVCAWYCVLAVAYVTFYYKGCIKERKRLQGTKSR
jgi:TRAP-type uncharacterized transport system fused permease subunit